jgi:hypothetical protein
MLRDSPLQLPPLLTRGSSLPAPASFRAYRSDLLEPHALPPCDSSSHGIRYPFRVRSVTRISGSWVPGTRFAVGPAPGLAVFRDDGAESIQNTLNLPLVGFRVPAESIHRSAWPDPIPWRVSLRQLSWTSIPFSTYRSQGSVPDGFALAAPSVFRVWVPS